MKSVYAVLRRPIITEKSTSMKELDNQVVFGVDKRASKPEIRAAVERLFGVRVKTVNTMIAAGKPKRFGRIMGRKAPFKKAVVTLHDGEDLDFFDSVVTEEGAEV